MQQIPQNKTAGYTLTLAMLIVRRIDTLPSRGEVFDEIKRKNRLIRWVSKTYDLGGPIGLRRIMIWLYMKYTVLCQQNESTT